MSMQWVMLMALVAYCQSHGKGQYGSSTRFNNNLVQPRPVQVDENMEPRHIAKRLDPYSTAKLKRASVHEFDEEGPFIVPTQNQIPTNRNRRGPKICNCCVVDRLIETKEIMPGNLILYPEKINIKACQGKCRGTLNESTFNGAYGRLMYKVAQNNYTMSLYRREFWLPFCFPNKMGPITISSKKNATDVFVQKTIYDMVIESCSCTVMSYKGLGLCHKRYPYWRKM